MGLSMKDNGEVWEDDHLKVYKGYQRLGGNKGDLLLGGPETYDVNSKKGIEELLNTIGGK